MELEKAPGKPLDGEHFRLTLSKSLRALGLVLQGKPSTKRLTHLPSRDAARLAPPEGHIPHCSVAFIVLSVIGRAAISRLFSVKQLKQPTRTAKWKPANCQLAACSRLRVLSAIYIVRFREYSYDGRWSRGSRHATGNPC